MGALFAVRSGHYQRCTCACGHFRSTVTSAGRSPLKSFSKSDLTIWRVSAVVVRCEFGGYNARRRCRACARRMLCFDAQRTYWVHTLPDSMFSAVDATPTPVATATVSWNSPPGVLVRKWNFALRCRRDSSKWVTSSDAYGVLNIIRRFVR